MTYVDRHLLADERVVYRTRLHWIMLFRSAVLAVVGLAVLAASWTAQARRTGGATASWASGTSAARCSRRGSCGCSLTTSKMLTSEFAVTNLRLILKVSLIARYTTELLISKVESIGAAQSLGGRVLGFGDLTVTGTGGAREVFRRVKDPIEFRNQVQRASLPEPGEAGRQTTG